MLYARRHVFCVSFVRSFGPFDSGAYIPAPTVGGSRLVRALWPEAVSQGQPGSGSSAGGGSTNAAAAVPLANALVVSGSAASHPLVARLLTIPGTLHPVPSRSRLRLGGTLHLVGAWSQFGRLADTDRLPAAVGRLSPEVCPPRTAPHSRPGGTGDADEGLRNLPNS